MAFNPPRVRRVPPPPPPGFGDEEYYRLYGRPEDYHKYRQELEAERMSRSKPGHGHRDDRDYYIRPPRDEYYSYKDYLRSHKDVHDYRYESDRRSPMPEERRTRKRSNHDYPSSNREGTPELSSLEGDETPEESKYENFRVTIRNESDGTPSLSGMDDDDDNDTEENSENSGTEDSGSATDNSDDDDDGGISNDDLSDEPVPVVRKSVVAKRISPPKQRIPVKERLGKRQSPPKASNDGGGRNNEVFERRRNAKHRSPAQQTRVKDRRRTSRGRNASKERATTATTSRSDRRDRGQRRRDSPNGRARTRTRTPPQPRKSSRKSNKKQRRREAQSATSRRMTRAAMDSAHKENEIMLRRLARKRRGQPRLSESDKNLTLARLAGLDIPAGGFGVSDKNKTDSKTSRRRNRSPKSGEKSRALQSRKPSDSRLNAGNPRSRDKSESSRSRDRKRSRDRSRSAASRMSGRNRLNRGKSKSLNRAPASRRTAESRRKASPRPKRRRNRSRERVTGLESEAMNSKRGKLLMSRSRSRTRSRSPPVKKKDGNGFGSPDRWQHDKFHVGLLTPEKDEDVKAFGSHWSRIRSERSKERERRSRSSSGSHRSRRRRGRSSGSSSSRSRSRSRGRRRRGRSYSSYSRSGSSSYSVSSSSSGSVRRERRKHKAETRKARLAEAEAARQQNAEGVAASAVAAPTAEKQDGVNFALSGKLLEDTNTFNGVVVKYGEPSEARKPKTKWRLYVFKGSEELPILYIHRQSAYLLGRDRKVADIPLDHPSCSKQHAVLQYRLVDYTRADGSRGRKVTPYIIDLESANGTFVNNQKIEARKYVQVLEKDVLKFGFSSREYVLLHDQSKEDEGDDLGVE